MEWNPVRSPLGSSQPGLLRAPSGSSAFDTAFTAAGTGSGRDRQGSAMFRTSSHTTPGRIESISAKAVPALSSFQSFAGCSQATPDHFMLGVQPFQQPQQDVYGFWQTQTPPGETSIRSFSFQRTAAVAGHDADLESLFNKAEATVDQFLDSPQAAMLFGNDISDALSKLCADEPCRTLQAPNPAAAAVCTIGGLAATGGSNPKTPKTPQSSRKRSQPCIGKTLDGDVVMEPSDAVVQRLSTDSGFTACRWGLDLSDEGSGRAVWRHSTGGSVTAAAAAASSQYEPGNAAAGSLKHQSQNPKPHRLSTGGGCGKSCSGHKCGSTTCGSIHGTKHKLLKIKPHGGLSPSSRTSHGTSFNRSSCPGGYLGRMSSSAAGGTFAAVLDLSQPDPNSSSSSTTKFPATAAAHRRTTASGSAAAAGVGGGSSSGSGRVTVPKLGGSPICCLDLSGDDSSTAAAAAAAAPPATIDAPTHAKLMTASCMTHSPCQESSSGCMPPAAAAANKQNNLSFTSWTLADTAAAPAAGEAAPAAAAVTGCFQSPFSNRAAVEAALLSPRTSADPAAAVETGSATPDFSPRKMRKSATSFGVRLSEEQNHNPHHHHHHQQQQQHHFCCNCGAVSTPLWRNGPAGPKTLCNACGVRYKKGGALAGYEEWKRKSSSSGGGSTPPSPEAAQAALVAALKAAAITAATGGCTPTAAAAGAPVQLSPFGAPQHQQQQQQQWPAATTATVEKSPFGAPQHQQQWPAAASHTAAAAAGHVGVSITTQSGTGPLTRRVSSQVLVFPGRQISGDLGFSSHGVHTLDYGLGFTSDGGVAAAAAAAAGTGGIHGERQQQQLLHLQLPRIRTTSQPLHSAVGGMHLYGVALQSGFETSSSDRTTNPTPGTDGYTSASGSGTIGSNHSSDLMLTPQTCQADTAILSGPAAAAPAAAAAAAISGSVPIASPSTLSNHIAHMSLYGANSNIKSNANNNSPASCYSSGSSMAGLVMTTPTAAAAACPGIVPIRGSPFGMPLVQQQQQQQQQGMGGILWVPQQQQQQQQQRSSVRCLNTDAALDAGLVQLVGQTVTTGLPLRGPRSTAPASFGTVQQQQQQQRASMWQLPPQGWM